MPIRRDLPNTALNRYDDFNSTPLGQRALQQRALYQSGARRADPGPYPEASYYGDPRASAPTPPEGIGARVMRGSPVSNRELAEYTNELMRPIGQDQADRLSGISPMPGMNLAMQRADARGQQFANQYRSAVQKQLAWRPPPMAPYNPAAPHPAMAQREQNAKAFMAKFDQQMANWPTRLAGPAGAAPSGLIADPRRAQIGIQGAPPILGRPGVQAAAPAPLVANGLGAMQGLPQPAAAPAPKVFAAQPEPDFARPRSAPVPEAQRGLRHGVALNPNNMFRKPGGGVGVFGVRPALGRPGVQAGPQAFAGPGLPAANPRQSIQDATMAWLNAGVRSGRINPLSALEDAQKAAMQEAAIAQLTEGNKLAPQEAAARLEGQKLANQAAKAKLAIPETTPDQSLLANLISAGQPIDQAKANVRSVFPDSQKPKTVQKVSELAASLADPRALLSQNYPSLVPYFETEGGKPSHSFPEVVEKLQNSGLPGYDNPNSELGALIAKLSKETWGPNLERDLRDQVGSNGYQWLAPGRDPLEDRINGLLLGHIFRSPADYYRPLAKAADYMNKISNPVLSYSDIWPSGHPADRR